MKKDIETYIDVAHLQGQILALLDQRNKLQLAINKKEEELEELKKKGE
jgi:peptidoglycan hydrolase CwlO-like protein